MRRRKSNYIGIIILLCFSLAGLFFTIVHKNDVKPEIQEGISDEVIRLHVIANSDTPIDQSVKLEVRNNVVTYMQGRLKCADTKEEAKMIMKEEIPEIKKIAQKTVKSEGYHYSCDVMYHTREFPVKVYGDLTFPSGKYEALDVVLGKAEGKNWWCVMFPTLCFVDGTYSVVPDKSKAQLKAVLTEEEYEAVASEETVQVDYKFKIVEWFDRLKESVSDLMD